MILLGVTLRYAAPWMGAVMLFYAAQFALHSYYLVMQLPNDFWHALINNVNFSGTTLCLIIGTAVTWRRRVRQARAAGRPAA
jgi:hypothetical protein